jgi:hypothetical protein
MGKLSTYHQVEALYSAIEDMYDPRAKPMRVAMEECLWVLDWIVENLHSAGYAIVKEEK